MSGGNINIADMSDEDFAKLSRPPVPENDGGAAPVADDQKKPEEEEQEPVVEEEEEGKDPYDDLADAVGEPPAAVAEEDEPEAVAVDTGGDEEAEA